MAVIYLAAEVRGVIGALYGPPAWTDTLDKCKAILAVDHGLARAEIPGRLAALAMAGHDLDALRAVAVSFGLTAPTMPSGPMIEGRCAIGPRRL